MKNNLIFLLCVLPSVVFAADYPNLLSVKVGKEFAHVHGLGNKDNSRPTTQFRIPNYGSSSKIFPEFELTYLNKTNNVAIVTAEKATSNWKECAILEKEVKLLAKEIFPFYKNTPEENSQLKSENEYSLAGKDLYYVLRCQSSYGPFTYLHFQLRSKSQDYELKTAYNEFFK